MATPISSLVTGVAGFDTTAAVDGLLAFHKLGISKAEDKKTAETNKQDAFVAINSAMLALKSTAVGMADSTSFFSYGASLSSSSASVPASSLLDVSGSNNVSSGQHSIVVQQIAQAQRLSSSVAVKDSVGAAVSSDSISLGLSGSFQIGTASVVVSAADSLQAIASNINQQNKGASATGVSASIIKVSANDYRMILTADATGATGFTLTGVALDSTGTLASLQLGSTGQANARQVLQTAQDAQVSIDGLSITRSNNTISDALTGVTLSLKQADPTTTVQMNIAVDTVALRANVQSFVDAYNQVQNLVNEQFKFDSATGATGILAGEGVLTSIQSTLSNSLLQSVPGLANDRNSMVMIGVEPDERGQLMINDTRFSNFLNNDPAAIRDVFVASGSSSNNQLQFLTHGLHTPSGNYQVNISQAASLPSILGTTDLTAGLASNESMTLTEVGSQRQAVVALTAGQTQAQIIAALNTEFQAVTSDVHQSANSLGASLNSGSSLASLGLGVAIGDTISIAGTNRQGGAVNSTFTVLDPSADTISTLLSSIQSAFNQQVLASLDATGHIQVTDAQSGDSLLSVQLTAQNQGGGSLNFGADTIITEGRYAMGLTALAEGTGVRIQGNAYGASSDFSLTQTVNGLGIADATFNGTSVAGTINGEAANGSGQLLIGSTGNVDGLGMLYSGSSTGIVGDITLGVGLGAQMEGILDLFANPFTGLIQNSILASQGVYDGLSSKIVDLEAQMQQAKVSLTQSFTVMQQLLSSLQSSGDFLTQQVNAQNGTN